MTLANTWFCACSRVGRCVYRASWLHCVSLVVKKLLLISSSYFTSNSALRRDQINLLLLRFTNEKHSRMLYKSIQTLSIADWSLTWWSCSLSRRKRSAKVMSRGLNKIWYGDSKVHSRPGWRGEHLALNYTPFWVEIWQKCVHMELRMRITTRPQALNDWDKAEYDLWP